MQGGGATGAGQNAETVDGQGTSANSDTLTGYGKPSDNGQSADDTLAGDGQNADTSAQSESSFTDEKLSSVLAQIQASLPASNGDWAVYVCDLKTGSEGAINDHRRQAASPDQTLHHGGGFMKIMMTHCTVRAGYDRCQPLLHDHDKR